MIFDIILSEDHKKKKDLCQILGDNQMHKFLNL